MDRQAKRGGRKESDKRLNTKRSGRETQCGDGRDVARAGRFCRIGPTRRFTRHASPSVAFSSSLSARCGAEQARDFVVGADYMVDLLAEPAGAGEGGAECVLTAGAALHAQEIEPDCLQRGDDGA